MNSWPPAGRAPWSFLLWLSFACTRHAGRRESQQHSASRREREERENKKEERAGGRRESDRAQASPRNPSPASRSLPLLRRPPLPPSQWLDPRWLVSAKCQPSLFRLSLSSIQPHFLFAIFFCGCWIGPCENYSCLCCSRCSIYELTGLIRCVNCWNLMGILGKRVANCVLCVCNLQYKLGRGSREKVQQFMAITGARCGRLIPFELDSVNLHTLDRLEFLLRRPWYLVA